MAVPTGTVGITRTALEPRGVVYAAGEEWTARSRDEMAIPRGAPVRVIGQEELTLIVESGPAGAPDGG
jgi:membrane-bound ClpP family serine protease